ncbi:MAG: methyltransferase [Chitinophagaceae bacterium]
MVPETLFNGLWYNQLVSVSDEKMVIIDNIKRIINHSGATSCLEIGMGTSACFSDNLSSLFSEYVIVEKEPPAQPLQPRVSLVKEDWELYPVQQKYDVIIASHVVYYFRNKEKAVEKMLNALSENGILIMVVNSPEGDYGNLKQFFFRQIGYRYQFTYDTLKSVLGSINYIEFTIPTGISFGDYDSLYKALMLNFDQFQEEYLQRRETIQSYLAEKIQGNMFTMDQKIFVYDRSGKPWKYLINHPEYISNLDGQKIWVKDGVFTPDRQITWSSSLLLRNLPDVKGKLVLDIGCGTGVIAIRCALQHAGKVVAADISEAAVINTTINAQLNNVENKLAVVQSDLFEKVEGRYHYIFGNLPILDEVWSGASPAVNTLKRFLHSGKQFVNPGGKIYFTWASFAPVQPVLAVLDELDYTYKIISYVQNGIKWSLFEVIP